ncbi:glutamate receptor 2.8-like [Lolium rigidum]|uniref:glutamate receptor 2.8-like n=1 Tax=Lolium rigidum TaxID=89674 RepID=UPI001F5C2150|nr:glutamate receptor 2.8-like [Lolium rigidum]
MAGNARRLFFLIGLAACLLTTSRAQPTEVKVGLIIDADSPVGKIATTTIPMALEDFYAAFPNSSARVKILQHDSGGDVVAAASAALQLMTTQGARAILGPQSSVESAFVADLATQAQVPVVSFSATSPSVSPATARFFSRAAQSDAEQAGAVAALAAHFGWRRVVPVYQDDDYGAAFVPFLVEALASAPAPAEVPYRCALREDATPDAVAAELHRMESEQTRVFVLHTRPGLARRVFDAAAAGGMTGDGYVWVITDGLTGLLGSVEPPQGVIGLAPYVPTTPRLREVKKRWAQRYMRDHPDDDLSRAVLGCHAVWAYDAAWAVASAADRLNATDLSSPPGLVNGTGGPTDISGLGKSASGENFLRAIRNVTFDGLGGKLELVDGELVAPAYRVLNIMDDGKERGVGFWSPRHGLTRQFGHASNTPAGELGLHPVIWPGESTVRPSGWVQPTNARKLRVAVPGNVSDSYRPILHLTTFDAVVADMTITADRAAHVDFTLPYMSTDIAMVVPLRDQRSSKLTPSNQAGTLVYFGFSTLVFAHREKLTSNLSRLVVVVWVFVVLILQSSYTASLTSMLTVPQVEPTIADYRALLRGTDMVGVMNNSFTGKALTQSGFPQVRIMRYTTARSFQEALLNGSIGAIINETPYFNIFLGTYNDNFTMTDQRNMTGGFGFAFPKGSPYVTDLSQAILKLTENNEINRIERKWFGDPKGNDSQFTSGRLSFKSFRSLFLITGITSVVCCIIHLIFNLNDNRRQPIQQITSHASSPAEVPCVIDMVGSPHSASYKSEGSRSVEMAIPLTGEIEPVANSQSEEVVALARHFDSSRE